MASKAKAPMNTAYRQRKPAPATGRPGVGKSVAAQVHVKPAQSATKAAPPASAAAAASARLDEEAERTLRAFDLDSRFGPCLGMTRLERWERAEANGLAPPAEVKTLIVGSTDPARKENLWHEFKEVL